MSLLFDNAINAVIYLFASLVVMDPVSVTASAIAMLQLTSEILKCTWKYYKGVKNAPADVQQLLEELTSFGSVLESLRDLAQKAENDVKDTCVLNDRSRVDRQGNDHTTGHQISNLPVKDLEQYYRSRLPMLKQMLDVESPLVKCYHQLDSFRTSLLQVELKSGRKAMKWPFKEDEVYKIVGRLRTLGSILNTAIISDNT